MTNIRYDNNIISAPKLLFFFKLNCPDQVNWCNWILSSPRAKRAGPKGPCAESARAVTGRRWFSGRNSNFWGQKKNSLLNRNHVLARTGQSCAKEKVPFSQINISLLVDFGCYFGKKRIFGPFSAFRQSVKTAVYGHFSVILAGTGSVYQRGSYYRWPGWSHQVSLT